MQAKKTGWCVMLLFLIHLNTLWAQHTGIFMTCNDYDSSRLSYMPEEHRKYRFIVNPFFYPEYIIIKSGDTTCRIHKDSVFGYRDEDGFSYRLYQRKTYRILNPGEPIMLYGLAAPVRGKEQPSAVTYYFSVGSASDIRPLTILNLKYAYPDSPVFHELIDIYFHHEEELITYDAFYKTFKINRVYQLSLQKK